VEVAVELTNQAVAVAGAVEEAVAVEEEAC
jgi:hypothetical protein